MTKTLYVGNISYSASEEDLLKFFERFGANKARIVEGRGFGFVDIDADHLAKAIEETDQAEMMGRKLNVNEARPRAEGGGGGGGRGGDGPRPSGGGGGGGYGGGGGGGSYGGGG